MAMVVIASLYEGYGMRVSLSVMEVGNSNYDNLEVDKSSAAESIYATLLVVMTIHGVSRCAVPRSGTGGDRGAPQRPGVMTAPDL
jgi:hypothetical protein